MIPELQDKTIGVIGVGQEGQAIARYLVLHGHQPAFIDEKALADWPSEAKEFAEKNKLTTHSGDDALDHLSEMQIIFRSPGFRRLHPALLEAEKQGAVVTSQTKWFFEHCPAKIIGVTGTKGKGTTTTLLYEILKNAKAAGEVKSNIYLTGNIGKQQPLEFLDSLNPDDLVAYEMSSFQLQDLTISPHIGICLMVTSDHLDHHKDLDEYHAAKQPITAYQKPGDVAIYNLDYPASVEIGKKGEGQKLTISSRNQPAYGAFIFGEIIQIKTSSQQAAINCQGRMLRGKHNLENIAAASTAATALGISAGVIENTVKNFHGLEHRLQFVATKNGISYFNDSISTVPDTAIAAVKAFDEPVVIIIGGSDKGIPFNGLAEFLSENDKVKGVVLIGAMGKVIKKLLEETGASKPIDGSFDSMTEAVASATAMATAGDVVVLSPATASFDMYKNYAERGHKFIEAVEQLP